MLVSTAMARAVPFAVRTLLGTNLPGLGFSVVYEAQPDNAQNRDFEKTHVDSKVVGGEDPVQPPPQPQRP